MPGAFRSSLTWGLILRCPLKPQVGLWHSGVTSPHPEVSQRLFGSQFPNLANGHNGVCWSSGFRIGGDS